MHVVIMCYLCAGSTFLHIYIAGVADILFWCCKADAGYTPQQSLCRREAVGQVALLRVACAGLFCSIVIISAMVLLVGNSTWQSGRYTVDTAVRTKF